MKTVYIVNSAGEGSKFFTEFAKGLATTGYDAKAVHISELSFFVSRKNTEIEFFLNNEHLPIDETDRFFIRTRKYYSLATALLPFVLNAANIPVNESHFGLTDSLRNSKIVQPFICKHHNIDFPDSFTTVVNSAAQSIPLIETRLSYPLVIKLNGSRGQKVWKCDNQTQVFDVIHTLDGDDLEKNIVFQEYIPNDFDIRVIVHYGKIIAAIARSSADGFLNNVSQGGQAESIVLTETEINIAKTATKLLDLELTGVDIVRTADGPLLFEVNRSPDLSCFNEAAGYTIPGRIAKEFIHQTSQPV